MCQLTEDLLRSLVFSASHSIMLFGHPYTIHGEHCISTVCMESLYMVGVRCLLATWPVAAYRVD